MVPNSLRDKVLHLIQSCGPDTTADFPALLELQGLLESGIRLDEEDTRSGNEQENDCLPTLIHHAAKTGSAELMKKLAQTQSLDCKTRSGLTALHVAAAGLHRDLVQFLAGQIDRRAATTNLHPRQAERGWTALHYAAAATGLDGSFAGQKAVIQLLLDAPDRTSSQGEKQDLRHVRDSSGKLAQHIFRLHHLSGINSASIGGENADLAYVETQHLLSPPLPRIPAELDDLMAFRLLTDEELDVCIETPLRVRECFLSNLDDEKWATWKSFHETGLCVADVAYGKGLDYLDRPLRHKRSVPFPFWRQSRWMHLPICNKVWLQDMIRACFVQRRAKLTNASTEIDSLRMEHAQLQDEVEHSLSGRMVPKLVVPSRTKSDQPQPKSGMFFKVPYLTACPVLNYKKMSEMLENCANSKATDPTTPEQMDYDVAMRLIQTYGDGPDILHMPKLLESYGRIAGLSQDYKARHYKQVTYQTQRASKGAIKGEDKLVCIVSELWLCLVDVSEDDRSITLITLSPDIEPLSTAFDLGHELHHYSGADSNMTQWIMKVRETTKIIPFIIGMTARSSLGHTLEIQQGAVKHGVLEIYAMAVSNAASCERRLVERFWKRVKKEAKGEADSLRITIKDEVRLIRETKKIINELEVVKRVLDDQLQVIIQASHRVRLEDELQGEVIRMSMVEINSRRIDDLLKSADEVTKNVYNLLDLKQKGANLAEAQWSREQAEETARQGNIIMVFTIVTIIFLPMSFLSSFFALEIIEFPRDDEKELRLGLKWTLMYILTITAAIAVPLVLVAFNINRVSGLWKHCIGLVSGNQSERHNKAIPKAGHRAHKGVENAGPGEEIGATRLQPAASSPEDTTVLGRKKPMVRFIGNRFGRRAKEQQADEAVV
ncbi:hypothetical protein MCOR04_010576 [Pyricularia oryzae]|nr:hypothetical protein MCOR01_002951 [Pyricularia oryzae]KAI6288451.1 hypothetical protein MCOR26_000054 [Pyricularia oryzae]KAI6414661.1 hypothetical protein MCOR20_002040 [Pyricularia oryzae]KAI6454709.1 hypothetical protein MCOR17_008949 [Pyricularia oryzae]KAI6554453.1 hypothetical protein MCOR04_010576 [Pyricularia oryzae]